MIETEIRKEADRFTDFWNNLFRQYPKLKLDNTWPSIGIIDKILFPLRNKKQFNSVDYDFIKGAAAYIGILAYKNWSKYDGIKCELKTTGDRVKDFVLSTNTKENNQIEIKLGKSIESILKNSKKSNNYFAQDSKFFTFNENLLSPFSAGIISGASPYVNGEWSKKTIKQFEKELVITSSNLSSTCVEFYSQRYAGEAHGVDKLLYHPNLVLPPIGSNEPHPGSRGAVALANFIAIKKLSELETKMLCKNLCFSPDQSISIPAFLVSCCIHIEKQPAWLYAISNSLGINLTTLRPSLAIIRESFSQKDFLKEYDSKKIKSEDNLGFLPLYFLASYDPQYKLPENLLYFLAWSSLEKAHDSIDNFAILDELHPELALQLAFLKINLGRTQDADKIMDTHFSTEPTEQEIKFRYHEIKYYLSGELEHLEQALATDTENLQRLINVANLLSRVYLSKEMFKETLNLSKTIIEKAPWSLSIQINQIMALLALKENEKLDYELEELSDYLTVNNQLFSVFKARKLSLVKN